MQHSGRQHARWSASATAANWACPGRLALIEALGCEDKTGVAAAWGTRCHEIVDAKLNGSTVNFLGDEKMVDGHKIVVDEEMLDCAQAMLDYVKGRIGEYRNAKRDSPTMLTEQSFSLAALDPPFEAGGTGDVVLLFPAWGLIEVVDLKSGRGVLVEAGENKQLRTYGLGALMANPGPWRKVRTTIVQPRAFHPDGPVRHEELDVVDLMEWTAELLDAMRNSAEAMEETEGPGDLHAFGWLRPGDHCTFCPAKAQCPALEQKALDDAQVYFKPQGEISTPPDPASLPVEKMVAVLDAADMIEGWLNAVRARAQDMAEAGQEVPGYQLVEKRGRRKWIDDEGLIIGALVADLKVDREDLFDEPKLRSPAQMEKALGKEAKRIVDRLTKMESSGYNLVRSDKTTRPAAALPAQKFFQKQGN